MCLISSTIKEQDSNKRSNLRTIDFSINASAANSLEFNLDLLKKTKDNL